MKKFIEEFKKFALRGNVMDMAVGVIIGGAFTGIVTALTTNFINPLLSLIFTGGPGDISDGVDVRRGACVVPDDGGEFLHHGAGAVCAAEGD